MDQLFKILRRNRPNATNAATQKNIPTETQKRFMSAQQRLLESNTLSPQENNLLRKVSLAVHSSDDMYAQGGEEAYLYTGISALRCIEEAQKQLAEPLNIRHILDLPSGYGRVLRYFPIHYPEAEITACELKSDAVEFCATQFGVNAIQSNSDLGKINLSKQFDLIWCGSLLTHIDTEQAKKLMKFFYTHLAPGGLCVVTTHGRTSLEWIENGTYDYGLSSGSLRELITHLEQTGYGYTNYDGISDYGISIVMKEKFTQMVQSIGNWRLVLFLNGGWVSHQDVYALHKNTLKP